MLEKLKESTGKAFAKVKEGTVNAAAKVKEGTVHAVEKVKGNKNPEAEEKKKFETPVDVKDKEYTPGAFEELKVTEDTTLVAAEEKEAPVPTVAQEKKPALRTEEKTKGEKATLVQKMKANRFLSHKLYIILFIVAFVLVNYSMLFMHHFSIRSLVSLVPDILKLIPEILKSYLFDYGFKFGFQPYAFFNFLISRILFRFFMFVLFLILFSAGLKHRRGKDKREKSRTITALVFTAVALALRISSDYWYRLSYESSQFMDDEIYHKLSFLLFGERMGTRNGIIFYCIVLGFLMLVMILSLVIQSKRKKGASVRYLGFYILCFVFGGSCFFLPRLTTNFAQSFVFALSVAILSVMTIIGTSIGKIRKEKPAKKTVEAPEEAKVEALPEESPAQEEISPEEAETENR
ncbi:MAG: hypothetical protein IKP61_03560 [Spirochaetales bacterium]|nr:hypothetical protein [Spirochaetales bacterium]